MMRLALLLLVLQILSACVAPVHHYTYYPPGAAMNLWGPYIHEAAQRFSIPQSWIRAIMNQESGGHQYLHGRLIRSAHGAVGLMQIKPETYAILARRYHLGSDPYNPHDNIIAGSGY
ncbi:MAG: transglycosylase SLT domain-containing protein, partial [Acetobacter sp.]|nr:transglycosylase SLT domain-containing protein [Acetobacter sp.]